MGCKRQNSIDLQIFHRRLLWISPIYVILLSTASYFVSISSPAMEINRALLIFTSIGSFALLLGTLTYKDQIRLQKRRAKIIVSFLLVVASICLIDPTCCLGLRNIGATSIDLSLQIRHWGPAVGCSIGVGVLSYLVRPPRRANTG